MNDDLTLVETLLQWHAEGHGATLITVVRTWGSSPRPVGSLMALRDDGRQVGSVSGGCIEEDLVARLRASEISLDRPTRVAYGATRDDAVRFGLPCGGRLEVVVEQIRMNDEWRRLAATLAARGNVTRRLRLDDGTVELVEDSQDFFCDDRVLTRRFGPRWRLLIVGAGDITRHVAHCAGQLDYQIVVCEPRAEVRDAWDLHEVQLDRRMPDEAAADLDDPQTAVVTLTHDPRIDDLALMEALTGRAFYVGALGSKATSTKRRARLIALGLPREAVSRLHAPVGLPIGSRTPGEIAISILSEITLVRRRLELSPVLPTVECML